MGGIYGEFLLAFPEQFKTFTVYDMTPAVNGGWTTVENSGQVIKGIFQHTGGRRLQDTNGNLTQGSSCELWTKTAGLAGKFVTINSIVYRLSSDNDWTNEGGFARYGLDKIVGNNGSESTITAWNIGSNNFG